MVELEFLPVLPAVAADAPTELIVAVRVSAVSTRVAARMPLNLALVIDRSGSMAGSKLERAKGAACRVVEALNPGDRLAVVAFDDGVDVVVPSASLANPAAVIERIRAIQEGGSTALAAGWEAGCQEVRSGLIAQSLNRVLILSDGQANVGVTEPDAIASLVKHGERAGVGTTAMGVGDDYEETLMEAIARSGDGNFWHIDHANELEAIFEAELNGLMATIGRKASIGFKPAPGVRVVDILNDFERLPTGRYKLPNLVIGKPLTILLKVAVGAQATGGELFQCRVAYDNPETSQRTAVTKTLELPAVPSARLVEFVPDAKVVEMAALLELARVRQTAINLLRENQQIAAREILTSILVRLDQLKPSQEVARERQKVVELLNDLQEHKVQSVIKKSVDMNYSRRYSRPD